MFVMYSLGFSPFFLFFLECCRFPVVIYLYAMYCYLEEHGNTSAIHFHMTRTAVIHYLLETGDLVSCTIYPVMCFPLNPKEKKKTSTLTFLVLPAPLIHVQPFEKSKDS